MYIHAYVHVHTCLCTGIGYVRHGLIRGCAGTCTCHVRNIYLLLIVVPETASVELAGLSSCGETVGEKDSIFDA